MNKCVMVRLREAGTTANFNFDDSIEIIVGDYVIVESDRGYDYAQIIAEPKAEKPGSKKKLKKIVRIMTVDDMRKVKQNSDQAKKDKKVCDQKIRDYKLDMKLINAEYSFDRSKIIFYFTAEGRVDFRELVKELAKHFKTRIEMRQVGVRDEAKLFNGIGPCGRGLCCSGFLRNFEPVTIKMAKEQNLPLNPTKISGICGRLMCCLGYEVETYAHLKKALPREGKYIQTPKGKAKVLKVYTLKGELLLEHEEGAIERIMYQDLIKAEKCGGCGKKEDHVCCKDKKSGQEAQAEVKKSEQEEKPRRSNKERRDRRPNNRRNRDRRNERKQDDRKQDDRKQDDRKQDDVKQDERKQENRNRNETKNDYKREQVDQKNKDEQSRDARPAKKKFERGPKKAKKSFFSSKAQANKTTSEDK